MSTAQEQPTLFEKLAIDRKKVLELAYVGALSGIFVMLRDKTDWIPAALDWLQLCAIFILLTVAISDEEQTLAAASPCPEPMRQFLRYWKRLWFIWLMFYLFFAIHNTLKVLNSLQTADKHFRDADWDTTLNLLTNVFNNLQSLAILLLFLIMVIRTTETHARILRVVWSAGLTAIAVFAIVEFYFCVDPRAPSYSSSLPALGILFSAFSGMFAGVTFCLFFGRLGSHYINMHLVWVGLLYVYATIQPLYPVFRILDTFPLVNTAKDSVVTNAVPGISATNAAPAGTTNVTPLAKAPAPVNAAGTTGSKSPPLPEKTLTVVQTMLKVAAGILKILLFLRVREILNDGRLAGFFQRIADDIRERHRTDHKSIDAPPEKS